MKIFFKFLAFYLFFNGCPTFAATPLEIIGDNFKGIQKNRTIIYSWDCDQYNDHNKIGCYYLKAYINHKDRKYEMAAQEINNLKMTLYKNNESIIPSSLQDQIETDILKKFEGGLDKVEQGGWNNSNFESFLLSIASDSSASISLIVKLIEMAYEKKTLQNVGFFYTQAHKRILNHLPASNVNSSYKSMLSLLKFPSTKPNNLEQNIQDIFKKIPSSQRNPDLDLLVNTYLKSLNNNVTLTDIESGIKSISSHSPNASLIISRLYSIYALHICYNAMLQNFKQSDMSKIKIRFWNDMTSKQKKEFKHTVLLSTEHLLNSHAPKVAIDELTISMYVMYQDLLSAPNYTDSFYLEIKNKYLPLSTDYMNFSDMSSEASIAITELGILQRSASYGEGLF